MESLKHIKTKKLKNIAIFGKSFSSEQTPYLQQLIDKLEAYNCDLLIFDTYYGLIKDHVKLHRDVGLFKFHKEFSDTADLLISIGGDGTLLDTITLVRETGIPILGINMGRLGFLSSISKDEIQQAIDSIMHKEFEIDERSLLRLNTDFQLFGDLNYAMNELSILKNYPSSMLAISAWIDDRFVNSYWADGLIIATPTGSTAYNLSCGGPILVPKSKNFILTPIATHNLTVRPIVIPDTSKIRIKVEGRIKNFLISLDSRSETIDSTIELRIEKEQFGINLIQMTNKDFYSTIRNKLKWGYDIRN